MALKRVYKHFLKANLDRSEIDLSWINLSSVSGRLVRMYGGRGGEGV